MEYSEVHATVEYGIEKREMRAHGRRGGEAKKVVLELCCELGGKSQREVGRYFGYRSNGVVGKQRLKLKELLEGDKALQRRLARMRKKLTAR